MWWGCGGRESLFKWWTLHDQDGCHARMWLNLLKYLLWNQKAKMITVGWPLIFSSPEPKAHRWPYRIGRHPSSVRPSVVVNIFKRHRLWSHEADSYHIALTSSVGRENEKLCFLFQSDKNSGCYSNLPLTYNGKKRYWHLLLPHCRYFYKSLQKGSLSNPLPNLWIVSKPLSFALATERRNFRKKYLIKSCPQKP